MTHGTSAVWIAPPEQVIARRRALGLDHYDEVWEGVYHMAPDPHLRHGMVDDELAAALRGPAHRAGLRGSGTFNLGDPSDFRIPDRGLHRDADPESFVKTAAMVIEILSPGDESFEKFDFYARHGVEEILVADPLERSVRLWRLRREAISVTCEVGYEVGYEEVTRSTLIGLRSRDLREAIDWP